MMPACHGKEKMMVRPQLRMPTVLPHLHEQGHDNNSLVRKLLVAAAQHFGERVQPARIQDERAVQRAHCQRAQRPRQHLLHLSALCDN